MSYSHFRTLVIATFVCSSCVTLATAQKAAPSKTAATKPGVAKAADWPIFRGVAGDGVVRNATWNPRFPSEPKIVWTAEVGIGFSSFSVVGNKVLTMGWADGQDQLVCLNLTDGKTLWSQSYPSKIVDNLHEGGPAATPTIDGDKVYTFGKEGRFLCFKLADGKPVWEHDLQKELDVKMPEWGFSSSPKIIDQLAIVDAGKTIAVNKTTGKGIWAGEAYRPGYGSLTLFERNKRKLLAVLNNEALLILDPATGKEIAKHRYETNFSTSACTPLIKGDAIFVSTGYGKGSTMFEFDGKELKIAYETKKLRSHMATPVWIGDAIYGIDGQSNERSRCKLVCIDAKTGEERWSQRGSGCGTIFAADDVLVVLSDDGTLITCEANPAEYKELAKAKILDGRCWTVPTLIGDKLLARNAQGHVVCVDVAK
ncbi:MAG: PQQ-like beta-propeller repeat protein [Pirellulales bacterium]